MIEIDKLRQVMEQVSVEKGDFTLFGLFLREESPDKWDLVISAPWLEEGKLKALGEFVEKLSSIVGQEDVLSLSRIVTLNHNDPSLNAVLRAVQVENHPIEFRDNDLFGLEIKHAYILRAKESAYSKPTAT
jgi:hypothetical protein